MKIRLTVLLILFLNFLISAQTQETGISVTVKNQLGEIITDAEIQLLQDARQISVVKSNKLGAAQFKKLGEGEYLINVTAVGFNNYQSERITVKKGELKSIDITLEVSTFEMDVAVGGDEGVDSDSFGTTKTISRDAIEKLPDDPEQLEKMIRSMAGTSVTGEEMPITVDGQPGGKIPPKAAIQQVRVNQNVFSSQYDGPNGGGIEFFTSASMDKFNGGAFFSFADARLNATDAFLGKRVPSQTKNVFLNLAGPLGKKASFFNYFNYGRNDSSVAINAKILNSSFQPIDFRETFAAPSTNYSYWANVTYDPFKKHKITLGYSIYGNKAEGQNVGGFSLASRENKSESLYSNIRFSHTYLASDNLVMQSRFNLNYDSNKSFGGSNSPAINVLEAFYGGGAQNDRDSKNINYNAGSDTTWQHNKYSLGFGWQFRGYHTSQNSTANYGGTYTFSGRIAPVLDANNKPILDSNGNVVTAQIDSLESYRRTLLFRQLGFSSAQIRNLGGGANQFTISGGDPSVKLNQYDIAFYQQNSYKISETFAASWGIRYENQTNVSSNYNFSPRIGMIWSPKNNPKKSILLALPRISAGFGVFYRRYDLSNFLAIEQASGDRSQYLITDPTVLDLFPNTISINQLQQFALPRSQRFISDELQTPRQTIASLTASKKLPFGFSSSFTATYTKLDRQSLTRNINAPLLGVRPLGNVGNVYKSISEGRGEITRLAVTLNFPEKIMYGNIQYSYTKAKNDIVAGSGSPNNPYDFSQEYGSNTNDGVHRVGGYFFYNKLPFKLNLNGNFEISSGTRFNIITGRDTNGDGFYLERPSFATDLTKKGLITTPYGVLDPNPAPGDKLIPRNLGRGESTFQFDMGLGKSFGFGEDKANKKPPKRSLYFNVRVNNVFNVVNHGNPIGNMSSPNFLKVLSGSSSDSIVIINGIRSGANNRSFAFSMGFSFQ